MAKSDRFYFENFISAADYSCKAAKYLVECLENLTEQELPDMLIKMHEIEHSADTVRHDMSSALARAFVTPVDREDLALISHNLDNVTDKIDEILQRFYMNKITTAPKYALEFAQKIVHCTEVIKDLMCDLENFKKPAKIRDLSIELNRLEEECDKTYIEAMRSTVDEQSDAWSIIATREIYECFEECADSCEHVADCVATVIMKNT